MVDSQKRIAVAFVVGAVIVAGAFVVRGNAQVGATQTAVALAPIERTHIDVEDSNKDGVPDWQDALNTSEPIILPATSTSYIPPTTVTGKFAVSFFEDFINSKMYGAFGDTPEEIIKQSTDKLVKDSQDTLFTKSDLVVLSVDDIVSLHTYGNQIASNILKHPNNGESEMIIFNDAVRNDKPERLLELQPIQDDYIEVVKDMLATPVPKEYVQKHLDLSNALNAVREDVRAMQIVDEDALYTLVRMKRYEDDVRGLQNALSTLFNTLYLDDNVRWKKDEPVSQLMNFGE